MHQISVQEAGASFVTIHPRTKRQTYDGRADWSLVAVARQTLKIPVIGNGDVVNVAAARQLLEQTDCHGIMIGRGAVQVGGTARVENMWCLHPSFTSYDYE